MLPTFIDPDEYLDMRMWSFLQGIIVGWLSRFTWRTRRTAVLVEAPAYAISSQQRASKDMSSQEPPSEPPAPSKQEDAPVSESTPLLAEQQDGDASMDTTPDQPPEETWEDIPEDVRNAGVDEISTRARLIDNDIRVRTASLEYKRMGEY